MQEVTSFFNHYRENIRHLWNTAFLSVQEEVDIWQLREAFEIIEAPLFETLVLYRLEGVWQEAGVLLPRLRVVPASSTMPLFINRTSPPSGYWDDPINRVRPEEVQLQFLEYFDFDVIGYRDWQYYRVQITASEVYPHLVHRHALIETRYARLYLQEEK